MADRYPLAWPLGWARTPASKRQRAEFTQARTTQTPLEGGGIQKTTRYSQVALGQAAARLETQLERLGAKNPILSTNVTLRLDGQPQGGQPEPSDVGAAVYFTLKGQDRCLACDKWTRVADNIVALANHIDALRRIDRYGVGTIDQAFTGYVGLPSKGTTWKTTLGFEPGALPTADEIQGAFRNRARTAHPDAADGSHDAMASLVAARDEGLASLKTSGA